MQPLSPALPLALALLSTLQHYNTTGMDSVRLICGSPASHQKPPEQARPPSFPTQIKLQRRVLSRQEELEIDNARAEREQQTPPPPPTMTATAAATTTTNSGSSTKQHEAAGEERRLAGSRCTHDQPGHIRRNLRPARPFALPAEVHPQQPIVRI